MNYLCKLKPFRNGQSASFLYALGICHTEALCIMQAYRRYTAVEQTRRAASFSPSCSQTRAFMYCSRPHVILVFFPDYEIHECIRQQVTEPKKSIICELRTIALSVTHYVSHFLLFHVWLMLMLMRIYPIRIVVFGFSTYVDYLAMDILVFIVFYFMDSTV